MSKQKAQLLPSSWVLGIGVTIAFATLASFVLFAVGGGVWFKSFLENAAPAWVQAIGSVAAIVAAAAIARQQSNSANQLEAKKHATSEAQKLLVIKALMVRAHGLSNDICKAFETKQHEDFNQISPELMLDTHHALLALPVFEIPSGLLALDVLMIGRALGVIREHWIKLRDDETHNFEMLAENIGQLNLLAQEVREVSLAALNECKKEITKRGFNQDGSLTEPA